MYVLEHLHLALGDDVECVAHFARVDDHHARVERSLGHRAREPVELQKINEQVKLKSRWSRGVGDGQGEGLYKINPLLVGDSIYVTSAEGRVASVDPESGRLRWKTDLDLALSGGVGHHGDSIFVGASEGLVMRLSADSGAELWRATVSGEVLSAPQGNGRYVVAQT